jgi:hypothetical protein
MTSFETLELRHIPPMSARHEVADPPPLLSDLMVRGEAAVREPFVGITSDGSVRRGLFPMGLTGVPLHGIVDAAGAFLSCLDSPQRGAVSFPVDSDRWRRWCNVHMWVMRHGLLLEDLTVDQRAGALELIRASLSARGFDDVRNVMRFNELLAQLTGSEDEYGEWAYFITLFGTPSTTEPWGWQLDGHHLNLHCFVLGDQMVLTPAFLGTEPCHASSGPYAGMRMFEAEERNGLTMVRSLSADQARRAILFPSIMHADLPAERSVPIDGQMMACAFQDNRRLEYEGLRASDMTDAQRRLLRALVATYVERMHDGHSAVKMAEVESLLEETHFCWMGGTDDVSPFYYKVQSPVILIEFDHEPGVVFANDEPSRHHVHTVVRTPNGNDYGMDLLRQHYEQSQHHIGSRS